MVTANDDGSLELAALHHFVESQTGAVPFTPNYQDGRRDTDSSAALSRIAMGAHTLEVRLLGKGGVVMDDHTYNLFDMGSPPPGDVKTALDASMKMAQQNLNRCQMF